MRIHSLLTGILLMMFFFLSAQTTPSVTISGLSIDKMGNLRWNMVISGSFLTMGFQVEYFSQGKWVALNQGNGTLCTVAAFPEDNLSSEQKAAVTHPYQMRVKFHKGLNRYRIRVNGTISEEVQLNSEVSNDDGSLWIMDNEIILERVQYYEVIDSNGGTVLKGTAERIGIASLSKGKYYLYTKLETRAFEK